MLERLKVSNFAIIDDLQLDLEDGFTILTGETGAGKSILLEAMRLLLGDRSDSDMVRAGAGKAVIEGVFTTNQGSRRLLDQWGLLEEDTADVVIVRRDISASGTSRSYLNGSAATLQQLRELGERQVDMHGQHDHTRLLSPSYQLQLLDGYGVTDSVIQHYRTSWQAFHDALSELVSLQGLAETSEKEKAFLEFQRDEIEQAALVVGEDDALEVERKRLMNIEKLNEKMAEALSILGEGAESRLSCLDQLGLVSRAFTDLSDLDPELKSMEEESLRLRVEVEDLVARVRDFSGGLEADQSRLTEVDDRLHLVRSLKRKYGESIEEVLAVAADAARRLQLCQSSDEAIAAAEAKCVTTANGLIACGEKLSKARRTAAQKMQKEVVAVMRELELPKAQLRIDLVSSDRREDDPVVRARQYSAQGAECAEFLVSLNEGEEPKPLRKVASGGEISRIMLAIKSIVAERDQVPTLVFDEIDTGISGKAAGRVGEKLSELGMSHQVLCITHLPQIAALGDAHMLVEKQSAGGRTHTLVKKVDGDVRVQAIAQMLSGNDPDHASISYARTLLERNRTAAEAK